jgi:hypothetical protein
MSCNNHEACQIQFQMLADKLDENTRAIQAIDGIVRNGLSSKINDLHVELLQEKAVQDKALESLAAQTKIQWGAICAIGAGIITVVWEILRTKLQ